MSERNRLKTHKGYEFWYEKSEGYYQVYTKEGQKVGHFGFTCCMKSKICWFSSSDTYDNFRRKGIARAIYTIAEQDLPYPLYSDMFGKLYPDAKKLWESLVNARLAEECLHDGISDYGEHRPYKWKET